MINQQLFLPEPHFQIDLFSSIFALALVRDFVLHGK
jgi:hypothetical protein